MSESQLTFQNISAGYGTHRILHAISSNIRPGEFVSLIGPNGAGKSTLIKAISGVLPVETGTVMMDQQNLLRMDPQTRARLVSVIPQARNLPPAFTVQEVVLMGRTPYISWLGKTSALDEQIAQQAMQRTNLLDLADRRMDELSGGEQQRVLVARAIAQQSRLLLLDEPTTHLDIQYQMCLLDIVSELAHQDHLGVLMAIHDLNMAAHYSDRILLLVQGQIIASGKPEEVLNSEILSKAYHVPIQIHPNGHKPGWISPF